MPAVNEPTEPNAETQSLQLICSLTPSSTEPSTWLVIIWLKRWPASPLIELPLLPPSVGVGDEEGEGEGVGVGVGVCVGVGVGVMVGVGVGVGVGERVCDGMKVGVGVGVCIGDSAASECITVFISATIVITISAPTTRMWFTVPVMLSARTAWR